MLFRTPGSNCPDTDAITLQSRVYTQAKGRTRFSDVPTAPPSYIGEPKVPTRPPTYREIGNPYHGRPGSYGYEPQGPGGFQGVNTCRQIITRCIPRCYREQPPDHWEDQGKAGEEIVDIHSLANSAGDTHTTRKDTKTVKRQSWVFYACLLVAMGVLLGLLGYFMPMYCKSYHGQKPLGIEKINEDRELTTIRYNTHHKETTRIPLDQFTVTDKFERRTHPIILAQSDSHNTDKTTTITTTFTNTETLKDSDIFVPYAPFPTYNSRRFITKTVIATTSILATVTEHTGGPTTYNNCCPTVTSYYPNYFHCPSPTLQPYLTLQCPYMPFKTPAPGDLKTTSTTSTMTLPCSAQHSSCRLPNGDFCIPETTYVHNPVACPTTCPPPPTETLVITHVVIAHPHGDYVCVVDVDTGTLRDATNDERYDLAGGKGWYNWDRFVERPVKGVLRLLGELGMKGLRKAEKNAWAREIEG
ncbi:hypothetical protein BGX38DRAFT_1140221 [Terfezia claveryi]|nr:hypothetical protein BGX38DRAFT_1140221 [Terfezia claveryi]